MPDIPCRFFLADADHPVDDQSALWSSPLPGQPASDSEIPSDQWLTYGEYFTAIYQALSDPGNALVGAAQHAAGVEPTLPEGFSIYLVKHGAFYHPARVVIHGPGEPLVMGITVAASGAGRERIESEVRLLGRLGERFDGPLVPRVFGFQSVSLASGKRIPLFAGEWFDGFDEFHLTPPDRPDNVPVLWKPSGPSPLSLDQAHNLYARATAILTMAYDPMTSEQIQGWHHAAGDFVARMDAGDAISIRLITVRRYGPLLAEGPADPEEMIQSMVLFFLSTMVRMRLDRADGVGDPMWAGPSALTGAIAGYLHGVAHHEATNPLLEGIGGALLQILTAASVSDLVGLTEETIDSQIRGGAERLLIDQHLVAHVDQCQAALRNRIRT